MTHKHGFNPEWNSHGEHLDGTGNIKPTPFDAHERATRGTYVPTAADSPDPDPATLQEYPKVVALKEDGEPVIARDAQHEAELAALDDEE